MQVDEQNLKRRFVDTDRREVEKGKRSREVEVNEVDKTSAIRYAIVLSIAVCEKLGIPTTVCYEVMGGTQVFNIAYNIHQYIRGTLNANESSRVKKIKANIQVYRVKGKVYNLRHDEMAEVWEAVFALSHGWEMDRGRFIAKTHTVMCLMQLFNNRIRELQIGPDSWIATKSEGRMEQYHIQSFGIPIHYRHFLSGISWDIGVRSTLSKFTSGLCQLAILASQDPRNIKYSQRNKIAVERAYNFIPQISMIAEFVMGSDAVSSRMILERMAHITALHGDKHKRKCSPSFSAIMSHCVTFKSSEGYVYEMKNETDIGFASKKAALLYREHSKKLCIPGGVDKTLFKQLFFHAFFGTHGEDQGVLQTMTDQVNWARRGDFKKGFFELLKPSNSETQTIQGIKLNFYSKNIANNNNTLMAQTGSVFSTLEVFSGFRQKSYDSEFLKFVRGGGLDTTDMIAGNASSITRYLDSIIELLLKKIEEMKAAKLEKIGTTNWYDLETASYAKETPGNKVDVTPLEVNSCFWSN